MRDREVSSMPTPGSDYVVEVLNNLNHPTIISTSSLSCCKSEERKCRSRQVRELEDSSPGSLIYRKKLLKFTSPNPYQSSKMVPILSVFVSLENDGSEARRRSFLLATTQFDIIELLSLVVDDYFSSKVSPTGKFGSYASSDPSRVALPSQGEADTVYMLGILPPDVCQKYESALFLLKPE